jgi:hypothetical protein
MRRAACYIDTALLLSRAAAASVATLSSPWRSPVRSAIALLSQYKRVGVDLLVNYIHPPHILRDHARHQVYEPRTPTRDVPRRT